MKLEKVEKGSTVEILSPEVYSELSIATKYKKIQIKLEVSDISIMKTYYR